MQILWKKYKITNFEMNLDECGIEQCTPGIKYNYEVVKNSVIHYISEGEGTFKINNQIFDLKKGDGFILFKGMNVEYTASIDNPWKYYWVGFSGTNANEYLHRSSIFDNYIINYQSNSKIPSIIKNMCALSKTYDQNSSDDILLLNKLYYLLYTITQEFPKPFQLVNNLTHTYIQQSIDFINSKYAEKITVQQIADNVNLSRSYLYKMFIKYLGKSPQKYLLNLRMYKATLLLKETDLSISQISSNIGYDDPLFFSKTFSKHFSISASQYRKLYKK
ncbi:AraC family transcriptional regulator [Clostridium neonatale]|uniref:HTH-type transcriptional regulator CdhR n=2 Tax=Clostridium neonatale TaxID=137838 RepID=A0A650M581_9CLOT|nr:AraC family transcriptional regulator [Clostridium neonatale]CAI3648574.1 putative transcription regulator, AraC-type [Clostridium neonatale]CAI3685987.1 putative transcription regulator, AraC-type [Clostridium neonatale]CAI3688720.1 putative transcription regulator, AraC-type [Clostridium neonatale]CAI3699326.1 putative transcription regulator, AraC-type [Clostridium neonatale]CAI3711371.1 putative transcription regulator, AraC-type [Clostridium neonatale]